VDPDAVGRVSGVGRGMDLLDRGRDRRRERGSFQGEFGASHCKLKYTSIQTSNVLERSLVIWDHTVLPATRLR